MKKHSTKKALLLSVFSLVICFSMLIGTTFAWFTDSVTSANNIIKSGNLDIELEYWDADDKEWKDVKGASDILSGDLWEPGYVDVAYLRVTNAGSLALKYQLGVNIVSEKEGVNQAGKNFKLSDYIYFDVVEGVNGENGAYETREAAMEKATETKLISQGYTKAGSLEAESDPVYLAMIVYMPTTVGNDANHNGIYIPQIDLGINVYATQYTSESDSFNNQYDLASAWVGIIPESLEDTTLVITPDEANRNGTITVNSAEDLVYLPKLAAEWASLYSASGNGDNFTDYKNGQGAAYYYHGSWTIELGADLDMNNIPVDPIDTTFWGTIDGNGHTISNVVVESSDSKYVALFSIVKDIENLNVNNVKVSGKDDVGAVVGFCRDYMDNVHVTNATIEGGNYVGTVAGVVYGGITDSSATNSTVTATGMTAGGLAGYALKKTDGNTAENVNVIGTYNVGGLLGQAQSEIVENNTVKNVTVISTTEAIEEWGGECRTGEVAAFKYDATVGENKVENVTVKEWGGAMPEKLDVAPDNENNTGIITVNNAEDLMYLNTLAKEWASLYSDDNGTEYSNYANGKGDAYYYSWNWTIKLTADIDLYNASIEPINVSFWRYFDGQGHTIKNAKIVTDPTTENSAGLFNANYCYMNNIKLDNIHVTGSNVGNSDAGVLSGSCNYAIDNVTITNSTVTGGKYTGGVVGYGYTDITNCTLENVTVKGGYKLGGVIGYICASGTNTGEVTGNKLIDCTVDGLGGGVYAGGKTEYVIGKVVGNYNCNGTCNNNTVTDMVTSATEDIGKIEAGKAVTQ